MDKKNVISLVIGLVIGALVIWLLLMFGVTSPTMIGIKTTPQPSATTAENPQPTIYFDTQNGLQSYSEVVAKAKKDTGANVPPGGDPITTIPCRDGRCSYAIYGNPPRVECVRSGCTQQCTPSWGMNEYQQLVFWCNCPDPR